MEQLSYERPREKIQTRGVAYLTTTELVQVIIGSGSARASGARLAKRVAQRLSANRATVDSLQEIQGIGSAKSSQIIAALELGRRFSKNPQSSHIIIDQSRIKKRVGKFRSVTLLVYFFDGAGEEIQDKVYPLKAGPLGITMQIIAKDGLELNARFLVVVMGYKRDPLHTTTRELDVIKSLTEALKVLSIKLEAVYRANATAVESWSDI